MFLELHITDSDMSTGSIPVTWCMDKELLDKVKTYPDPHILIVVNPTGNYRTERQGRYLVPLKEMMTYVSFMTPGENKIYGILTKDKDELFLNKYHGEYSTTVVTTDDTYVEAVKNGRYQELRNAETGELIETLEVSPPHVCAEPLTVEVPAEHFAKEPARWEKAWVLWLVKDKGADQCAFRRRRLFAYTIQPLIMLLKLVGLFQFIAVAALLGMRGTSLKFLFHPLTYDFSDATSESSHDNLFQDGTIFVRPTPKKYQDEYGRLLDSLTTKDLVLCFLSKYWSLPFMPPIFTVLFLITHYHKWLITLIVLACIAAVVVFIMLCATGAVSAFYFFMKDKVSEFGGTNQIDDLVCTGDPNRKPRKKSIRLRYLAVKAKVCRPFAR